MPVHIPILRHKDLKRKNYKVDKLIAIVHSFKICKLLTIEKVISTVHDFLFKVQLLRKIGNSDFSTKPTNYYNLDLIISVGYSIKSLRGTQFRQLATKRLNEYIRKGFVNGFYFHYTPIKKAFRKFLKAFNSNGRDDTI